MAQGVLSSLEIPDTLHLFLRHHLMTYRELLSHIQNLTEEQMDREILVYNSEEDFFFDDGTDFKVTDREITGLIDADFPYLAV